MSQEFKSILSRNEVLNNKNNLKRLDLNIFFKNKTRNIFLVFTFIIFLFLIKQNVIITNNEEFSKALQRNEEYTSEKGSLRIINEDLELNHQAGYLVYSENCKIPNVDPFDQSIMKNFKREEYNNCTTNATLTNVKFNSNSELYSLFFDAEKLAPNETRNDWRCCYQSITRNKKHMEDDNNYELSKCVQFNSSVELLSTVEFILVECKNSKSNGSYHNAHAMIPTKEKVQDRLKFFEKKHQENPLSVLMIGVDSMSRANLLRGMPLTAEFLYDHKFFEISGYNKVGDNTLPNLMPVLSGYNLTTAEKECNGKKVGGLDKCPFIWKLFESYGYTTAYAEDAFSLSTFNYIKKGFKNPPVDYYLRPFVMATQLKLKIVKKAGLAFCIGYKHGAEYIYDYALEFARRFRHKPYFGLFWTNTFTHNSFDVCSTMDTKMLEYFKRLHFEGIMKDTVIIFFSDHGMRWGSGNNFYEERLPFLYIWLPDWLKKKHPEIESALQINRNRLTNPFDLHMTLKNIIELSGRLTKGTKLEQAMDCKSCQSLFLPVPKNRSCEDIQIEEHWCTCNPFEEVNKHSNLIKHIANFSVSYLNNLIENYPNDDVRNLCSHNITLKSIFDSNRQLPKSRGTLKNLETYRIVFETTPSDGLFEATVQRNTENFELKLNGDISRVNSYRDDSKCVTEAKKYCFCNKVK